MPPAGFSVSSQFLASAADAGDRAHRPSAPALAADARDRALLDRLRMNDPAALDALMQAYSAKLGAFAESIVTASDVASDVVQDVFVWLWEQRAAVDVHGSVGAYLYRATRNGALNAARRERAQQRVADGMAAEPHADSQNAGAAVVDEEGVRAEVEAILRAVPPRCRQIFLLVWGHELTYAEVADVLSVGVRTVQNQYYRAVSALAQHFEAERRGS